MRFTWDLEKARSKLAKRGVSFEEAASALLHPFALEAPDLVDSSRLIVLSMSARHRVLFVVTLAEDDGGVIRIISARRASTAQRKRYEEAP